MENVIGPGFLGDRRGVVNRTVVDDDNQDLGNTGDPAGNLANNGANVLGFVLGRYLDDESSVVVPPAIDAWLGGDSRRGFCRHSLCHQALAASIRPLERLRVEGSRPHSSISPAFKHHVHYRSDYGQLPHWASFEEEAAQVTTRVV